MSVIAVQRNHSYPITVNLSVFQCGACSIVYGIPKSYAVARQADGATFYCPNGHELSYHETDLDREKQRASAAEQRAEQAEAAAKKQRQRAAAAERSASAYKGQVTRIKNRIAAGVCPVPGCRRSGFIRTMRHIASKHPTWHAEHAHELTKAADASS